MSFGLFFFSSDSLSIYIYYILSTAKVVIMVVILTMAAIIDIQLLPPLAVDR